VNSNNFGQNEWLVDQMYQQFKEDPQSVDKEWRDLFTDGQAGNQGTTTSGATTATTPGRGCGVGVVGSFCPFTAVGGG
jgi:2-oxoglutarate dehydrogenase complex dehydrogenase (E1) component-like enzyme